MTFLWGYFTSVNCTLESQMCNTITFADWTCVGEPVFYFPFDSTVGISLVKGAQLTVNGKVSSLSDSTNYLPTVTLHLPSSKKNPPPNKDSFLFKTSPFRSTQECRLTETSSSMWIWGIWALPASPSLRPAAPWATVEAQSPTGFTWGSWVASEASSLH